MIAKLKKTFGFTIKSNHFLLFDPFYCFKV